MFGKIFGRSKRPHIIQNEVQKWVGWDFCGWIRIVGVTAYSKSATKVVGKGYTDMELQLVREPENPHDQYAVSVFYKSERIGYIDRTTARTLAKKYDHNMPIRALLKKGYAGQSGAIAIDILPQMPSSKERKERRWENAKRA